MSRHVETTGQSSCHLCYNLPAGTSQLPIHEIWRPHQVIHSTTNTNHRWRCHLQMPGRKQSMQLGGAERCWEILGTGHENAEDQARTIHGIHRHLWVDHDSTPGSLACQNTILGIGRQRMALAGQAVVQNGKWLSAWCLANARKDRRTWKCSVSGAATSGLPKVYVSQKIGPYMWQAASLIKTGF